MDENITNTSLIFNEIEEGHPCYGCYTLGNHHEGIFPCPNMLFNLSGKCPCTNCLVKVMCNEECDNWYAWLEDRRNFK
jgi:hypothetical protein